VLDGAAVGRSSCIRIGHPSGCALRRILREKGEEEETHRFKDNPDHQAAGGTHSDLLAVAEVVQQNLKAVAAGTRVRVQLQRRVECHIFDFDLVVDGRLVVGGHLTCADADMQGDCSCAGRLCSELCVRTLTAVWIGMLRGVATAVDRDVVLCGVARMGVLAGCWSGEWPLV